MFQRPIRKRKNLVCRKMEMWRPPSLSAPVTARQRLMAAVRRWFDLQAGSAYRDLVPELTAAPKTVIDVGCGGQPYRALLPSTTRYLGLDIAEAKEHFGYEAPDTLYFRTCGTWPVGDGVGDLVLMTEVLEHVLDPAAFLAEAFRVLCPGGHLVMTVPFAARWHFIPHDYWRFTPSCLERLLRGVGFGSIAVYARGNALTVACYKLMALMLPLLLPQLPSRLLAFLSRCIGFLVAPFFVAVALIGNISLLSEGGDDCLGYTVLAFKPHGEMSSNSTTTPSACRLGDR